MSKAINLALVATKRLAESNQRYPWKFLKRQIRAGAWPSRRGMFAPILLAVLDAAITRRTRSL